MVVSYADPAWTPLFPRASDIVIEVGRLMCHAAVLAREFGVLVTFGGPKANAFPERKQHINIEDYFRSKISLMVCES
jgi:phosphoenolpyruvate synthase/pyruvate phosphate dikinase